MKEMVLVFTKRSLCITLHIKPQCGLGCVLQKQPFLSLRPNSAFQLSVEREFVCMCAI